MVCGCNGLSYRHTVSSFAHATTPAQCEQHVAEASLAMDDSSAEFVALALACDLPGDVPERPGSARRRIDLAIRVHVSNTSAHHAQTGHTCHEVLIHLEFVNSAEAFVIARISW